MCRFCGHPGLVHDLRTFGGSVDAAPASGTNASGGSFAGAIPTGSDPEITFLSGVTSGNQVAATAFWTWNNDNPATYSNTSFASKWGSTTPGTAGGNVTYWFDTPSNWTAAEQAALASISPTPIGMSAADFI